MRFDDLYQQVGPSIEGPMPLLLLTEGWLEASDTLVRVRDAIVHQANLSTVARFDTDQLLDQRARRPTLTVIDGVTQGVDWPELELAVGTDQDDNPFLVLHGPEPDFAWRQFGKAVANIAGSIGVTTTFVMGAYPAPTPHTRPMRISSTGSDAEMLIGRHHTTGLLTVPAGVQVAVTEELERFDIQTHGLYAQVPYYLSSQDWPHAAIAMLDTFGELAGLRFLTDRIECGIAEAEAAVESLFAESPALAEVVARLEQRYDELQRLDDEDLPTGDQLEEELQRYLRDQNDQ